MNKERNISYMGFVYTGILILLIASFLMVPNLLRAHASGTYTNCQSNERHIGEALDRYAADHKGKYPVSLSLLTAEYLETIPTCPKAHKDTYSLYYRTSKDRKRFTFYCRGINHRDVGITEKNWPRYSSEKGLDIRPD